MKSAHTDLNRKAYFPKQKTEKKDVFEILEERKKELLEDDNYGWLHIQYTYNFLKSVL